MTFVNTLKGHRYIYSESAKKDLRKINKRDVINIDNRLKLLIKGYPGLDIRRLISSKEIRYRLRVGSYRVIYEIHKNEIVVMVISVGHRKDIYQK